MKTRCAAAGRLLSGLLLVGGSVLLQTYAIDVEMKDASNVTCLYAKWMMNLTITYESKDNTFKKTTFTLPDQLVYDGSTCGNDTHGPVLAIAFGEGHSWVITFTKTDTYQGRIFITYNTNDTELFPDAKRKGPITTFANYPTRPVKLNTLFVCNNVESIEGGAVKQDFRNVTLQAFPVDGFLSNKETLCDQDATTPPTITSAATEPTTNTTTTTNMTTTMTTTTTTTTAAPRLLIVQTDEKPSTGHYMVNNGTTACLLANMALQLNISQKGPLLYNFSPNTSVASGRCGSATSVLELTDKSSSIAFLFAVKAEIFYLKEVNITVFDSNETLFAANRSLNYWVTSLGSSYMCRSEETIVVSSAYRINVFDLKIQPFEVEDNEFSTAEHCNPAVDNVFVPIVVGVALAGLVFLVLMAYFVGRKTHRNAAYEQF